MPMDDRKQRILTAIVSLYASDAEPVGSNLLSQYFNMAVSSATLRNEMAALTRLGLLEQPHTSAGRVPTAKGYRYYVENLLGMPSVLHEQDKETIDRIFEELDYDPEKLAQGAARALSQLLGYTVIASTPRAEDMRIAHFEVVQVGRYTAAVLAVTNAGGVRTRVAKVNFELSSIDVVNVAKVLNNSLRFVAAADIDAMSVRRLVNSLGEMGGHYWPVLSAALTLLDEAGTPSTYCEGQQYLLQWPELETNLRGLVELMNDPEELQKTIQPHSVHTTVLFGDEMEEAIPGLCIVARRYLAGGGLTGTIAVAGPARMLFKEVIPILEYFSEQLGKSMSG